MNMKKKFIQSDPLTRASLYILDGEYNGVVARSDYNHRKYKAKGKEKSYVTVAHSFGVVNLPGDAARDVSSFESVASPSEHGW